MFGRRKRTDNDTQIPYQLYETVHEPTSRRWRWALELVVSLAVVTVVVIGGMALYRNIRGSDSKNTAVPDQAKQLEQSPQENNAIDKTPTAKPATTPLSKSTNNTEIKSPF